MIRESWRGRKNGCQQSSALTNSRPLGGRGQKHQAQHLNVTTCKLQKTRYASNDCTCCSHHCTVGLAASSMYTSPSETKQSIALTPLYTQAQKFSHILQQLGGGVVNLDKLLPQNLCSKRRQRKVKPGKKGQLNKAKHKPRRMHTLVCTRKN